MTQFQLAIFTVSKYNILPLTSTCNLKCIFCSHHQNPKEVETFSMPPLEMEQVEALLDFLDNAKKIVIGESATRLIEGEPFTHPDIIKILRKVRQRFPNTKIEITTNGSLLTLDLVKELRKIKNLEMNFSLNSATPEGRRKLMGDKNPSIAIQAPHLLHKCGISYHGSLVANPLIVGWEDIRKTILYLAEAGAKTVRIFLPEYTRLTPRKLTFPLNLRYQIKEELDKVSQKTNIPILLEPPCLDNLEPIVEGVIPGSCADKAGIKKGDIILSVDNKKPYSRVEAFRLASVPGLRKILVKTKETIDNKNRKITDKDNLDQIRSYDLSIGNEGSGLTFAWDFDPDLLMDLEQVMRRYGYPKTLIMTSELAYNIIKFVAKGLPYNLEVIAVPNRFFAGSIACAGLLTINDYLATWKDWQEKRNIGLILVPSKSFDHNGRDLTGKHYLKFSNEVGLPVEIV